MFSLLNTKLRLNYKTIFKLCLEEKASNLLLKKYSIKKEIRTRITSGETRNELINIVISAVRESGKEMPGYSSTIILARSIAEEILACLDRGCDALEIKKGIVIATDKAVEDLYDLSIPLGSIRNKSSLYKICSKNDKHIIKLIKPALSAGKVQEHPVIGISIGSSKEDEISISPGYYFDNGYKSPFFINYPSAKSIILKNCHLLYSQNGINDIDILIPAIELTQKLRKPLVIIAEDIDGDALYFLIQIRKQLEFPIAAVQAPTFQDSCITPLEDMSTMTGGTVFKLDCDDFDLECINPSDFGKAEEIIITEGRTLILRGGGNEQDLSYLVGDINEFIKEAKEVVKCELQKRLKYLTSNIYLIHVGGNLLEEKEKKIHDLRNTVRLIDYFLRDGAVPGGGVALLRCSGKLNDLQDLPPNLKEGVDIMKRSLLSPCQAILKTTNRNSDAIIRKLISAPDPFTGFDIVNGEFVNMMYSGIIDSTKVVSSSLRRASRAALALTEKPELLNFFKHVNSK